MSQRLYIPFEQLFTNLGAIAPGWKICTYETQTTTPKATYSNPELTVANANPADPLVTSGNQVADADGRLGSMFVSSSTLYKVILKDDLGNTIQTMDPVDSLTYSLNIFNPIPAAFWGTTAGTSSAFTLDSTVDISVIGYQDSQVFELAFHIACAAAPTLNIDSLGAINLKKYTGQGTKVALQAGDVQVQRYWATNDGSDIIILNPRNQVIYSGSPTALTIATGVITLTNAGSSYTVDTEAAAAYDEVITINGGVDGQIVTFRMANAARIPIFKNDGAGNLSLSYTFAPDAVNEYLTLIYDSTSATWREIARSAPRLGYVSYEVSSGTAGGAAVTGSFQTRPLNTKSSSTPFIPTLATNQFTLSPGTYFISSTQILETPLQSAALVTRGRIRNITATSSVGLSVNQSTSAGTEVIQAPCDIYTPESMVEISVPTVFELQYYMNIATGGTGLGVASFAGTEIYAVVSIKKM